jgi:sulfur carrier protein
LVPVVYATPAIACDPGHRRPPTVSFSTTDCGDDVSSSAPSIAITVNGEDRTVPSGYPLTDLLEDAEVDPDEARGVAVALNESVVRRQDWDDVTLVEGDTVEIVTAQQGG